MITELTERARARCSVLALVCSAACGGSGAASPAAESGNPSSAAGVVAPSGPAHSGASGSTSAPGTAGVHAAQTPGASGHDASDGGHSTSSAGQSSTPGASGGAGSAAPRGGIDAGSSAAPSGGAGGGVSPSGSALFWDSFESDATLDMSRYEIVTPNCSGTGMIALDASTGHGSVHSLRVQGSSGFCNHVFVRVSKLSAPLPSPLYVRVFVKAAMPLGPNHTTFAAMHDMTEDKDLRLGGQDQVLVWNRESDDATLPELSPTGVSMSAALGTDTWQCLEWMVDGEQRKLSVWLDGMPVAGLALDAEPTADVDRQWLRKTDWQPKLLDLRLGWENYSDQSDTLWFDDLAVGSSRLGCTPDASPRSP